jgi:carboxylesterase
LLDSIGSIIRGKQTVCGNQPGIMREARPRKGDNSMLTSSNRRLKKAARIAAVIMLLSLSIVSIFNGCAWNSMRKEEYSLMNGGIQQRFSEIRSDGTSPAVLLIHGYGGSPFDVKPLCDALEKRGYAFHAILLPGHGTTPRDLKNIKEKDWLDATGRAYDELKQKYGTVSVVGFSMGGAIAVFTAAENDVSKLVLISPYFKVRQRWFYFGKPEAWARRFAGIIPYVKKPKIGQINDPDGLERYIAYRHLPTKTMRELSSLGRSAVKKAKDVECDTLWMHSKSDIVADFQLGKKVFDSIPAKKKHFVQYEKSNHILLYDYDRIDAIDKAISFLEEQ